MSRRRGEDVLREIREDFEREERDRRNAFETTFEGFTRPVIEAGLVDDVEPPRAHVSARASGALNLERTLDELGIDVVVARRRRGTWRVNVATDTKTREAEGPSLAHAIEQALAKIRDQESST